MKVKIMTKSECIEIAKSELGIVGKVPSNVEESGLVDYLPDYIFGNEYTVESIRRDLTPPCCIIRAPLKNDVTGNWAVDFKFISDFVC